MKSMNYKQKIIVVLSNNIVWFLLVISLIVMGIYQPAFFTVTIIKNIMIQASALGIMTIGLAHVLLLGEIDLSIVGSMAFSAGLGTYLMKNEYLPWWAAVGFILLFGCVIGLVNGIIITKLKAASLIETIAMNLILMGGLLALTAGRTFTNFPQQYNYVGKGSIAGVPLMSVLLICVFLCIGFLWNKTTFGRSLFAVGGNIHCAKASGINVDKVKISAFVISSGLCALAGWMYSAYMGAVPASFGDNMQMYALASAVIGGVSLAGGVGKVNGVLGGVLLITLFQVGLNILGINPYLINTAGGLMIMVAVIIDALKNKYKEAH